MKGGPDRADTDTGTAAPRALSAGPWMQAAGVALLLAGLWRRDCVLLASAPLLAQRSLPLPLEGRPGCPLHAAMRAFTAGALCLAAALALGAHVLGVQLGWWWAPGSVQPGAAEWLAVPALLLAPALLLVASQRERSRMGREALFWLVLLVAATLTAWAQPLVSLALACVYAAGIAVMLAHSAWRLTHDVGSGLLRQAAFR